MEIWRLGHMTRNRVSNIVYNQPLVLGKRTESGQLVVVLFQLTIYSGNTFRQFYKSLYIDVKQSSYYLIKYIKYWFVPRYGTGIMLQLYFLSFFVVLFIHVIFPLQCIHCTPTSVLRHPEIHTSPDKYLKY